MRHTSLHIIQDEHRALAAMLSSVVLLMSEHHHNGTPPPFTVLRAMLFYMDEFPERLHHRKESQLLFPKIRARSSEGAASLDRLDHDHASGEKAIRDLEHALVAYEMLGASRRAAFEQALTRYVDFYRDHMRLEEDVVLPLAQKVLTEADWVELDAAFEQNRDPLLGHAPDGEYAALFHHIVQIAPAPVGLG
ncbi:MAG: hemerythrin domain-containing protein [Burkholderiales bacterium]